jgi:hypothetical protein
MQQPRLDRTGQELPREQQPTAGGEVVTKLGTQGNSVSGQWECPWYVLAGSRCPDQAVGRCSSQNSPRGCPHGGVAAGEGALRGQARAY